MKTLTATAVARRFSHVLDQVIHNGEEITIIRNKQPVAKIVPGTPRMNALEALADLYQAIDFDEGERWITDSAKINLNAGRELCDPWE